VAVTLVLAPVADLGLLYVIAAAVLGGALVGEAVRLRRDPTRALRFFKFSNTYLAGLFVTVAADVLVRAL
jgi:protoheme IX farnesyltransferase